MLPPRHITQDVSDAYADARIQEKIDRSETARQRDGLLRLHEDLRGRNVPPSERLHLITAVSNLGRVAARTLPSRVERANEGRLR